jgi:Replication-relaxation
MQRAETIDTRLTSERTVVIHYNSARMHPDLAPVMDPLDEIRSARVLDLRARVEASLAGGSIDRPLLDTPEGLPDAIDALSSVNTGIDTETAGSLIAPPDIKKSPPNCRPGSHDGPKILRDQDVVLEIARYRVVSFAHLRRFIFANRDAAVVTRRMQALERAGFIGTWEDRLPRGGHPRYALLTDKGLRWGLQMLRARSMGGPHEQLVQFMLRARPRKPLVLAQNSAPPFLPHQTETNLVAASFSSASNLGITWASTWHRPFPNEVRGVALPQPDAVLVMRTPAGRPHLVFLEHDRGQEAPASFAERKATRYQLLLDLDLAPELFGFETFSVLVTIVDPTRERPFDRLRALQDVSAASMMRFTLATWVRERPDAAVWFAPETPIRTTSVNPDDHAGLLPPFSNLRR